MATDGAPFPSVEDDLRRQIMGLRASLASAEAEVARLKAPLEPKRPYEPKVGDVVTFWNGCVGIIKRLREGERAWRVENKATGDWWEGWVYNDLRPATPAERAAAGLPAEAPAKPEVLPEHLAFLDAMAAERTEESHIERPYAVYRTTTAARALLAAVARRDGGGK